MNCEGDEEQLNDSNQRTDSDNDEYLLNDNAEHLGDKDDSLTDDDTQFNDNSQDEQDLRARDCIETDPCLPTHFESKGDIGCVEKKADNFVESLNWPHEKGPSENRNVSSNAEAHFATESGAIKHKPQEDDKGVGSQEVLKHAKRVLQNDEPEQKPE